MTMRHAYIVTGTLTDAYSLTLDEAIPLMSQQVRVVVEPLVTTSPRPYRDVMSTIRARQQARAHQPPTREEVDAAVRAERERLPQQLAGRSKASRNICTMRCWQLCAPEGPYRAQDNATRARMKSAVQ